MVEEGSPAEPADPAGTKVCPSCAETIQASAVLCRYCRYDFRTGGYYVERPETNGFAVASLVLGILGMYGITAILALIFGYRARGQIDRSEGRQGGRGLAVAGIVLGWVMLVLSVFVIWYTVWFFRNFPDAFQIRPTPV